MNPGNRRRKEKDNTQEKETKLDTVVDSGAAGSRSGYCNGADCVDLKSVYSLTGCFQTLKNIAFIIDISIEKSYL